MIDSHPEIMCGPEAPWIAGRGDKQTSNIRELTLFLTKDKWGPVNGFTGVTEEFVYELMASLLDGIMSESAQSLGKSRWADKTPENIIAVPFLYRLFPNAKFVHIFRDGRDVALSTQKGQWATLNFQKQKVKNNYANALRRWSHWIEKFQDDAEQMGITYHSMRYEDLVCSPKEEMQKLLEFLEVGWSDAVLSPYQEPHDIVDQKGEGIKSFNQRQAIDTQSLYRWKHQLNWFQRYLTKRLAERQLVNLGYGPTS